MHALAQHTASWASGETTSLYTHEGEFKAYAANGAVSLRAHTDRMALHADKAVVVTSVNDEITIQASQRIELVGADAKIVLDGGNISHHTQAWTVHAAGHEWAGPAGGGAVIPSLPDGRAEFQNWIEVQWHDSDLVPLKNAEYLLTYQDGTVKQGSLDVQGGMHVQGVPGGVASLRLVEREPFNIQKLTADTAGATAANWLSALNPTSGT